MQLWRQFSGFSGPDLQASAGVETAKSDWELLEEKDADVKSCTKWSKVNNTLFMSNKHGLVEGYFQSLNPIPAST